MDDIIISTNSSEIERITGENQKTIRQWKKGTRKAPESAIRLLKLYVSGNASALLGKDWEGHYFKDDLLYIPEWRRGLTPHEIRALFWDRQLVSSLKREIEVLKQTVERRSEEIDILEVKAAFYKQQVVLESRFGLMLQGSFL